MFGVSAKIHFGGFKSLLGHLMSGKFAQFCVDQ
jgi:hypothetical protein